MFQVVKRDGEIADFQMAKISSAINKAFEAKEKNYSQDMIDLLALRAVSYTHLDVYKRQLYRSGSQRKYH